LTFGSAGSRTSVVGSTTGVDTGFGAGCCCAHAAGLANKAAQTPNTANARFEFMVCDSRVS